VSTLRGDRDFLNASYLARPWGSFAEGRGCVLSDEQRCSAGRSTARPVSISECACDRQVRMGPSTASAPRRLATSGSHRLSLTSKQKPLLLVRVERCEGNGSRHGGKVSGIRVIPLTTLLSACSRNNGQHGCSLVVFIRRCDHICSVRQSCRLVVGGQGPADRARNHT